MTNEPQARRRHTAARLEPTRPADGPELPIQRIGVLHHPKLPATAEVGHTVAEFVRARGCEVVQASTWEDVLLRDLVPELDLLIVLGGDGSTLRAARVAAAFGVPNVTVHMGRLGFLAELRLDDWQEKLPRILNGDFWLERRMMLQAELWRAGERIVQQDALNELVISRGSLARVIRLHTDIDGGHLTTYTADGLICATPTGSTAYALAVGGPVLPPELRNILLIPIAPHLSFSRAIVLAQGAEVKIEVLTDHQAILTADGQFEYELHHSDKVLIHAAPYLAQFARVRSPSYFYRTLMDRLDPEKGEHEP